MVDHTHSTVAKFSDDLISADGLRIHGDCFLIVGQDGILPPIANRPVAGRGNISVISGNLGGDRRWQR